MAMEQSNTLENVSLDINIVPEMKTYLLADFSWDFEKKEISVEFVSLLLCIFLYLDYCCPEGCEGH